MAAMRKDGRQTCNRLLEAATCVFAEKGYRDTTVADIGRVAGCNAASINYHFGSKEQLYAAVWRAAFDKAQEMYPIDGGLTETDPAPDRLRAVVRAMMHRVLGAGELGCAGQILLAELGQPTEAIEMVRLDAIEPIQHWVFQVLRDLLGEKSTHQQVDFCAMSVVHQCLALGFKQGKVPPPLRDLDPTQLKGDLIEHIFRFSMAGIESVRLEIEAAS